jgi:hypothetical protein
MEESHSRLVYLYRDASNYKFWGEFSLRGKIDLPQIREFLLHGEYFIPEKVGVPKLTPQCMNPDDHELHEIDSVESFDGATMRTGMYVYEFLARMKRAHRKGWFF